MSIYNVRCMFCMREKPCHGYVPASNGNVYAGHSKSRLSGFTLIELLISVAIFLFLGILLVSLFRSGMDLWHSGEAGKTVFVRARKVLSVFRDDFSSMHRYPCPRDDGDPVDVRFASDFAEDESTEYHSQRIRFVRTVPHEMRDSLLRDAGSDYVIEDPGDTMDHYDQFNDSNELSSSTLASAGGMMEVGYLCRENTLYRAVKAPVGYTTGGRKVSLFSGNQFFSMQPSILENNARILARNILHYEVRLWAPDTENWDAVYPPDTPEPENALYEWDSTAGTPGDPSDDMFPAKAKILIVVDSNRRTKAISRFVSGDGANIECTSVQGFVKDEGDEAYEHRFIKVGHEWISYTGVQGNSFTVNKRGARYTEETGHSRGDEVYQGRMFTLIIDIPGAVNE